MIRRSLRTTSAGLGLFAIMLAASSIEAQETNTVGNPQLKDFELPGTRTSPPTNQQQQQPPATPPSATTTPPAATTPPVVTTPPADLPAAAPPPTARPTVIEVPALAPAPARPRAAPRTAAPASPVADAPAEAPAEVPAPAELEQVLPAPTVVAPPAEQPAGAVPAEAESSIPWLYVGLGTLLPLLALLAFTAFKRSRASAEARPAAEAAPPQADAVVEPDPLFARRASAAAAPPPAAPAPAPEAGLVGVSMRPRIELEFKPDRAAATLTDTSVQFELTIRNVGNQTARDIRIQARMDNAGPEQNKELDAFFAQPLPRDIAPAIAEIPPGSETQIRTGITLPKENVRELTVQGRRLFVPVLAFNVYYEWENGRTGQTSRSYIVGREAPTPQDKLGAFRLDLGPRLYRSVGQRPGNLAKVV